MDASFAHFRTLLSQPPTKPRFQEILSLIASLPLEEQALAVDYVEGHIQGWPPYVREDELNLVAALPELDRLLSGQPGEVEGAGEAALHLCRDALQSGDFALGFDWALAAWKSSRSAELAALVETIDARLPGITLDGNKREQQAQWLAHAAEQDARKIGALWRSLYANRTISEVTDRVNALSGWADDPRSTSHFLMLAAGVPWTSNGSKSIWRLLFLMFESSQDTRILALEGCSIGWEFRPPMVAYLTRQVEKILPTFRVEPPPIVVNQLILVEECMALLKDQGQEDAVGTAWHSLAQAPDDAATRQALIDAWDAEEDPRGRWTSLRAKKKRTKAENAEAKALKASHEKEWLGDFGVIFNKGAKYKQGFLDAVKIKHRAGAGLQVMVDDPRWCTITSIECYITNFDDLTDIQHLSSLRSLTIKRHDREEEVEVESVFLRLSQSQLRHQLEKIQFSCGWFMFAFTPLVVLVCKFLKDSTFPSLREFHIDSGRWTLVFSRDEANAMTLRVTKCVTARNIEYVMWALPPAFLTGFVWDNAGSFGDIPAALSTQTNLLHIEGCDSPILPTTDLYADEQEIYAQFGITPGGMSALMMHWHVQAPVSTQHDPILMYAVAGECLERPFSPADHCNHALSPDGRYYARCYPPNTSLSLIERSTRESCDITLPNERSTHALFFAEDLLWCEGLSDDGMLTFFAISLSPTDAAFLPRKMVWERPTPEGPCLPIQVHPTDGRIILGYEQTLISQRMGEKTELICTFPSKVERLYMSPSGRWLVCSLVGQNDQPEMGLVDLDTNALVEVFVGHGQCGAAFDGSEESFFFVIHSPKDTEASLYRFLLGTCESSLLFTMTREYQPYLAISPEHGRLALMSMYDGVDIVDIFEGRKWYAMP